MPTGSPESKSKECEGPRARGVMALARGGVALAALSRFEPKKRNAHHTPHMVIADRRAPSRLRAILPQ